MPGKPPPPEEEIKAIIGHEFPGGTYTIEHWENFLLTECTGAEPLPGKMVHPVALFHMPILGANTTIGEMFAVGKADSDHSIGIESYDWEMYQPLEEDTLYTVTAKVTDADRRSREDGRLYDRIQFQFDLADPNGDPAARTTITWHYNRSGSWTSR